MKTLVNVLVATLLMTSCSNGLTENTPEKDSDKQILRNQNVYESTMLELQQNDIQSDAFSLHEVTIANQVLKIKVSYSGGCAEHSFQIIWPEVITMIYPPDFGVVLMHDSNGDACEAYFTETLVFELDSNQLALSEQAINEMRITVINGSNPDESVSNR